MKLLGGQTAFAGLTVSLLLTACAAKQEPQASAPDAQQTSAEVPAGANLVASAPNINFSEPVSDGDAEGWPGEPSTAFFDACLLAPFPTGGLVRNGQARVGDFLTTISGDADGAWQEAGPNTFIYRFEKRDQLTATSDSVAVQLRQTNTAPVEEAACGPRTVVVTAVARNGQQANPMQLYAAVRQMAGQAQRARDSGALGVLAYHEPTSTKGDGPYTERVVSEQEAANLEIAREMRLAR